MIQLNLNEDLEARVDTSQSTPTYVIKQLFHDSIQWFANYAMIMGSALTYWGFHLDDLNRQHPDPLYNPSWQLSWIPIGFAALGLTYTVKNLRHHSQRRAGNCADQIANEIVDRQMEKSFPGLQQMVDEERRQKDLAPTHKSS